MRNDLKNVYRKVALWLCLCLMVGILPESSEVLSASKPTVKLIIAGKYVTQKTYKLKKSLRRQLNVKTNNTFGKTTTKFTSSNTKIATVNSKGYIKSKKTGTVKISVKVTCKSGKKKKSTTTWTKIKVYSDSSSPSPSPTTSSSVGGAMQAVLVVNGPNARQFPMTILDNEAGRALYNALPKALLLNDEDKNVKSGYDPDGLYFPMEEYKPKTLLAGDFMLYGNSKYELTYEQHTSGYEYTRLGRIMNPTGLKETVGTGPVSVTIIRSSLPGQPTPTPSLTPRPSASVSPGASGSPNPSASVRPSGSPNPSASARPSGSPGASASPGASSSAKPTSTPSPTPIPEYGGPRIRVQVPTAKDSGGFSYLAIVNTSSKAAMNLYNSLSYDREYVLEMTANYPDPYKPDTVDYYKVGDPFNLTHEQDTDSNVRWSAGSVVLVGNYIRIFRSTVSNGDGGTVGSMKSTVLATIDPDEIKQGSGWLSTMFNGAQSCTVQLFKA